MNFTILRFDEIDSTNTEALNQARRGADEGLCVVARRQTAGRGRHGRTWISEKDAGLFFSVVLRPAIETRLLPLVTLMSAVAVHDALETLYEIDCDIKWVNDIHVAGKKICGILAETAETPNRSRMLMMPRPRISRCSKVSSGAVPSRCSPIFFTITASSEIN